MFTVISQRSHGDSSRLLWCFIVIFIVLKFLILTKSYYPNFGRTTKPIPRCTTSIYIFFHCRKLRWILPSCCGVRSRNSKLRIVLKFLIFDQVVPPQLWSHDVITIQVHNFNIYILSLQKVSIDSVQQFWSSVAEQKPN